MEQLLKKAAENMRWMANNIHTAHHMDPVRDPDANFMWQACSKGVCASMEHMLAQIGFDKDLNPIPVRP
jgi:hypothetical protein